MARLRITYFFLIISFVVFGASNESALRFNHFTVDDGLSQNTILAIAKDKYGFMWFGTWEGVSRFDGYSFRNFRADEDNPTALSNNRINAIVTDNEKNIWIQTGDNRYLFLFNYDTETFIRFVPSKVPTYLLQKITNYRQSIKRAENKRFQWVADNNGLVQTDKLNRNYQTVYQNDGNSPFALTDHVINAVYLDDCDNLWIGTQNGGINIAGLSYKHFDYYSVISAGLTDNVIRAVCQDKTGKLWIGTDADGIAVMDRNTAKRVSVRYGKDKLIDPNIRAIHCDRLGNIWIGTKGGLDKFDPQTGRFRHYYPNAPGSIKNGWVFWIMEDHNGNLWVGTFAGIAKYDRNNDRFLCYDPLKTLCSANVRVILEDSRKFLWVATEGGGITRLQRDSTTGFPEKLTPRHYRHINGNSNSLINDLVLTMVEDEDKKLWIGTNSGLCRLDPTTNHFDRFSVLTGFPDDLIMGLLADGKGHVWVSHKKGLTCMDIRTFALRNFNRSDGLQGNEFTQNAYYRNPATGEMFFGGTNGLNAFFPDRIALNSNKPQPVLTGLKVLNQLVQPGVKVGNNIVLEKSLLSADRISLTWRDISFSITFSSLNYDNPNGCRFKYKLEGIDRTWIYTDASMREATYTHLPAGLYTFTVYASNSDGVWSDKSTTIQIQVLPPWWLSWWAKGIYTVLFFLIGWSVYRYLRSRVEFRNRLLMERLKNEKNEELMNMKLQFFTEISHEFRTPLTLIVDPLEQLLAGKPDAEQTQFYYQLMNRNARQLLELINQLLDFRKLQSGNLPMNFVRTNIVSFAHNIAAAFEHKAREQHIRFLVQAPDEQLMVDIDPDKMRKILNNLISNAFRFTPSYGEILVRIYKDENAPEMAVLEIQDNGSGISPEYHDKIFDAFYQTPDLVNKIQGSGIGLALTRELVLLQNAEISLRSDKGKGACFILKFPCRQKGVNIVEPEYTEFSKVSNVTEEKRSTLDNESDDENLPLLLVVDDNADIRDYICMNFSQTYRTHTANDGLDGFNCAVEIVPDLIISDIMMPGVDGIELCRRLKTDERTSHIPVILLTARQSDESIIEGYDTGADAYVIKPFNVEVLASQMTNLLEQRRKLRELYSNGSKAELKKIAINVTDEAFLNKVVQLMEENMDDPDFDADQLVVLLKMSRSQLYRKIRSMTNRTVHDFITSVRMNKSLEYLLSGDYSISETGYKVGYTLPTNFTRTFTKHFGISPTKYLEKHKM